jgi:PAS domain S-box-containing protein
VENWSVERKTLAGFIGAAIVLLLVIAGVAVTMQTFIASSRGVWYAGELASARDQIYSSLVDAISSQRTFAMTGDEKYLQARNEGIARMRQHLKYLHDHTREASPAQRQGAYELDGAIELLIGSLNETQRLRDSGGSLATRQELSKTLQERLTETRQILTRLDEAGARELATRLELDDQAATLLYVWLAVIAIAMFVTLGWLLRRITADLRERRNVEVRLQETNGFLESLLENIPTMVFAKDAENLHFVRLNRAGEKLLGRPREALLGKGDSEFFPDEQAKFFVSKDREVLALGDIVDIPEEEIDTAVGRRVLHTRKVPVRDALGRPQFLLGISMDITEEKATQRQMIALNEELRRHAELLESSNRELESFCYSVSHDLRAPLRAINGFARMLEQDLGPRLEGEGSRYLRTICNASERMGRLIDDLLEFSRIGRQILDREPTDMRAIVSNVVNDLVTAREKQAPSIDIGDLPSARCDRRLLHLVWLNLVDNAVKYSAAASKPQIFISADSGNDEIVYRIRDNGIGFDMRYYDKLFGVFQRLHADALYPGTGVGLAISHRIIARHGGRIWAESTPGNGALFCFSLPSMA